MFRWLTIALALACCPGAALGDKLVLANGDEIHGEIVKWAVDYVVIEHPQLGRVRLELDQLQIDTGTPPSKGLFDSRFMRGWNRSIDLGLNGKQGNSTTSNLTAGFDFNYRDEWRRWRFNGRYFFQREDNGISDNNARIDLRRDWLFPGSRWFAFVSGTYQFDQFESWKHRTVLGAGPGFHVLEGENHFLDLLLGVNYTREYGGPGSSKGEGMFGIDYTWQITERHSLTLSNNLFFELVPSPGGLRNLTTGEWSIALTQDPNLSLIIGAQNEWENDVPPGDKQNDLKYYLSLALGF